MEINAADKNAGRELSISKRVKRLLIIRKKYGSAGNVFQKRTTLIRKFLKKHPVSGFFAMTQIQVLLVRSTG
jgi:hypothetical protein